jgi:hypothetical protein
MRLRFVAGFAVVMRGWGSKGCATA